MSDPNVSDEDGYDRVHRSLRGRLSQLREMRRRTNKFADPDYYEALEEVIDLCRAGLRNDRETLRRMLDIDDEEATDA